MELTRELVQVAYDNDHAATTVLLASRWLQSHPDDLGVTLKYASMLYGMTRYEDAIRVYQTALGQMTEDHHKRWCVLVGIGLAYRYWGRLADAETWFRQAIDADPTVVTSYVMLGACQARQGKLKEAEKTHRAATQVADSDLLDEAHYNLGLVLRGQDRWAEAAECFRKAIETTPDYAEAIEALKDVEMAMSLSKEL
ncbi:MAG: tetratricopeptide repeat protein [Patescibacteria group bacterium]|nr:tetratricopeptide repeat protein [Patescibacteria group bacterium]